MSAAEKIPTPLSLLPIKAEYPRHNIAHVGMSPALVAMLRQIGGLHMEDPNGILRPEYASLTAEEASAIAARLD